MARSQLAVPVHKTAISTDSASTVTSSAQTQSAAADQYALVVVGTFHATTDPVKPTISNSGQALTWIEVADHIYSTGVNPRLRMTVFYADVSSGFTSTTFTAASTGASAVSIEMSIWRNVDLSFLSNFAFADNTTGDPSITLGALSDSSTSAVYTAYVGWGGSGTFTSAPSGYTSLNNSAIGVASGTIGHLYDVSSPSTTLSYVSTGTYSIGFALELRAALPSFVGAPTNVFNGGTAAASFTTPTGGSSLAAVPNQYLLISGSVYRNGADPAKPTITSNVGLTFTEIADHIYSAPTDPRVRVTVWYADASAGFSSSATLTIASTSAATCGLTVAAWNVLPSSFPITNIAFGDAPGPTPVPTCTMGAISSGNAVWAVATGHSTFTGNLSLPNGYTQLSGVTGTDLQRYYHWYDLTFPSPTISTVGGSTSNSIIFGLELAPFQLNFSPGASTGSFVGRTGTTLSSTVGALPDLPVGSFIIVGIASDNFGTTDAFGADDIVGVTDSAGNTYTLAAGYRNGQGGAASGAHASIWYSKTTNALTAASGTITVTNTTGSMARTFSAIPINYPTGGVISVAATAGAAGDAGVDPVATISGLAADSYLFVGVASDETNSAPGIPVSGGWNDFGSGGTTGGSAVTNNWYRGCYTNEVATGKTFTPITAGDAAAVLVAFKVVSGPTGNLATAETGSDAAAVTATVPVAGSLARSETGPDTSAITGTVEPLPTIIGSLAVAEATTDTAAFNVVVPIQGSLAVAESGSDTAALDGTLGPLPITASVDAQETGSDTAASNVLAIATGSLNSAETGSDTASLSSTAAVTSAVAATETGSDVAALNGTVAGAGTFAAIEAGADAASADIRVIVTSAALIVETGSDTAALAGTGSVAGTLAVAEIGPDSASFDAAVRVAGTLAATETGSDTASATGTAAVAGSLNVIEVGSDLALFYTGAEAITQASLASTEIGSDTAAFAGTLGDLAIIGSLNSLESGPDTALANGAVSVTGTLAVTEIGEDLASFVGGQQQFIFVTLDAQEIGSDTAAFIGTVSGAVVAPEKDRLGTSVTRFEERRHKPRKRAPLAGKPLTDKQIRQLQDKVHEKRQAIWKRPEPVKKPVVIEPIPAPPSTTPAELEKAKTAVSIAKVQLEFEDLRRQREAELAIKAAEIERQQEAERLKRVAVEQEQEAREAEQERIRLEALHKQEIERQQQAARLQEMLAEQERKLKEAEQERARVEKQNAEIARIKKTSETIAHFQRLLAEQEQRIREVEEERIRVEALHRQNQEVMAVLLS